MTKPIFYIAGPYSNPNPQMMQLHYELLTEYATRQTRDGYVVFSPITHSHELARYGTPTTWAFWKQIDEEFLKRAAAMIVVKLTGWEKSIGVTGEREFCEQWGIPIFYVDRDTNLKDILQAWPDATITIPEEN